jgi:holo-[acyl-carrier protein] synthase
VDELPGIGFDLIEIERLERAIERRPRLAQRLFSDAELAFAEARRRPGRHLAARFAAKEAAQKALGLGGMRMHEIEVQGGGEGPPSLRLSGSAAEVARAAGVSLSVSLTHSRELAAATVVARPLA